MVEDVTVLPGATLTLNAGVIVQVKGAYTLETQGTLQANGTAASPIQFISGQATPAAGNWTGLYFTGTGSGTLTQVQVREGAGLRQASWGEALGRMSQTLTRLREAKQLDRVAVILSTHLTNEDLYAAKRLFRELGIQNVTVQGPPRPGPSDNFLLKADRSPNTRGAQALGLSFESAALLERATRKELSVLWVFGLDLIDVYGTKLSSAAASNLELLIFQGSNTSASCQLAHVILPSAVYAEKDGTFTNCQGRIQRIHQVFPPLGEAKLDWQILAELAQRLGVAWNCSGAQAIFEELAAGEPAFQGLTYEAIGDHGAPLKC